MINTDNYFIELPNLKVDQQDINDLLKMVDSLSQYWIEFDPDTNIFSETKPKDIYHHPAFDWGCWLKYPDILNHPLVKKWISKLPSEIAVSNSSIMKSRPWFHLRPHRDKRDASFILALTPNPSPLYFLDENGSVVLEHVYTCPTVINTHTIHGTNNLSDRDRITFQLGIIQPWEEIVEILKRSELA